MKTISIREFIRNFYRHVQDLPVIVTRRGKPYLKVTKYEKEHE